MPIVIGIETIANRTNELTPFPNYLAVEDQVFDVSGGMADLYLDFIVNNLKPYIDKMFRTRPDRENTALSGVSFGGLFSLYGGLKRQDIFSKINVFSAALMMNFTIFNWTRDHLPVYPNNMRMFFTAGDNESWPPDIEKPFGGIIDIKADMFRMVELLNSTNGEIEEGGNRIIKLKSTVIKGGEHRALDWQKEIPDAYSWLFYE